MSQCAGLGPATQWHAAVITCHAVLWCCGGDAAVAQNLVAVNATWETRSSGDGAAMLAAVRDADFPGVTGQVRLDRTTWDRDPSTVAVIMESWV